jgi:hypothetical protein
LVKLLHLGNEVWWTLFAVEMLFKEQG